MANNFQCVRGVGELLEAMRALPQNIAKNTLRGAVNAGASVFRKEAVRLAPVYTGIPYRYPDERVDPGLLKRAIYQKHMPGNSNATTQTYIVGVRSGKGNRFRKRGKGFVGMDAYYAKWVEFGHWFVPPRPQGVGKKQHRSRYATPPGLYVPARPFMRPAFDTKKTEAAQAIENYLRKRIADETYKRGSTDADDSGTTLLAA
ncbi:HK97-gp10 family putative phage morphogenesis protein [Ralstonia sp. 25C]|uniref:HK97-gp10 family putative phage morphogenesis protein n=1 Tax=Ralstonia sp. 25C TaxID=3447363 RepID=UPI003F756805